MFEPWVNGLTISEKWILMMNNIGLYHKAWQPIDDENITDVGFRRKILPALRHTLTWLLAKSWKTYFCFLWQQCETVNPFSIGFVCHYLLFKTMVATGIRLKIIRLVEGPQKDRICRGKLGHHGSSKGIAKLIASKTQNHEGSNSTSTKLVS